MPAEPPTTTPTPPASVEAFRDRLASLNGQLPRRLQQCADYLANHADKIALSTVAQIAKGADVPPSAVMRFCQVLGFSGFAELQRLFRSALPAGLPDYATRLANLKAGPRGAPAALVAEFVDAGRQSLEALAQNLDETTLEQAVSCLSAARTIHLAGLRRSFPVVAYLAYVFEKLEISAHLHAGTGGVNARAAMVPGDVLLVVSFAPYSAETLALAHSAKTTGLPVVALTDRGNSPLGLLADTILTVTEVDFGAFRSLSATIALALSLAVAVAARRGT